MFGEIPLNGEEKVFVKNNSIKLPEFTLAEAKEVLCFINYKNEIRLCSVKEYEKFIEYIKNCFDKNKFYDKRRESLIRYYNTKGFDEVTVKRDKTIKSLKFLKENLELILVGSGDHIKFLTKDQYCLYKNKKV